MRDQEKNRARLLSPAFDKHRQRGLRRSLVSRANAPRCGARSRQTGEPCRQPVKEEGKRCRYHGGATPKGKEWHRRQWPKKGASPERIEAKIKTFKARDRKAEARRAAMTPEERELHEKRRREKRPGTPSERRRAINDRKAAKTLQQLLDKPKAPLSDEQRALETKIKELEATAAGLAGDDPDTDEDDLPEVFK